MKEYFKMLQDLQNLERELNEGVSEWTLGEENDEEVTNDNGNENLNNVLLDSIISKIIEEAINKNNLSPLNETVTEQPTPKKPIAVKVDKDVEGKDGILNLQEACDYLSPGGKLTDVTNSHILRKNLDGGCDLEWISPSKKSIKLNELKFEIPKKQVFRLNSPGLALLLSERGDTARFTFTIDDNVNKSYLDKHLDGSVARTYGDLMTYLFVSIKDFDVLYGLRDIILLEVV